MPELAKVLENSYSKLLVIWWYWDFVCRGAFRLLDLLQIRPLLWWFGWQPCFLILVERGRKNNRKNTLLHTDNFSVETFVHTLKGQTWISFQGVWYVPSHALLSGIKHKTWHVYIILLLTSFWQSACLSSLFSGLKFFPFQNLKTKTIMQETINNF